METIVDFYVELLNYTESNIVRIDSTLTNFIELYVTNMYYLVVFLLVTVLVQARINYTKQKQLDSLQEQIYAVHNKFDKIFSLHVWPHLM